MSEGMTIEKAWEIVDKVENHHTRAAIGLAFGNFTVEDFNHSRWFIEGYKSRQAEIDRLKATLKKISEYGKNDSDPPGYYYPVRWAREALGIDRIEKETDEKFKDKIEDLLTQ